AKERMVSMREAMTSARFMPLGMLRVNRNSAGESACAEEFVENAAVGSAFHWRQPTQIEAVRTDPARTPKFRVRRGGVNQCFRAAQPQQKIVMSLPAKSLVRDPGRETVSVGPTNFRNPVGLSRQRNLFEDFARQSFLRRLARLDSALGKLPGARSVGAFANQDMPRTILDDRCHRRAIIRCHLNKVNLRGAPCHFANSLPALRWVW